MDSILEILHYQINRAIRSAINDGVIPEIEHIIGNLPLNRNGLEPSTSLSQEGFGNA